MFNIRQNFIMSSAITIIFFLFLLIVFGDKGLADLNLMEKTRDGLAEQNETLFQENLSLYRSIERLQHDPNFIENVARQELGVIGENEIIFRLEPYQKTGVSISKISVGKP